MAHRDRRLQPTDGRKIQRLDDKMSLRDFDLRALYDALDDRRLERTVSLARPTPRLSEELELASDQPVIEANGGILVERFQKPIIYGGAESLRFRIVLDR